MKRKNKINLVTFIIAVLFSYMYSYSQQKKLMDVEVIEEDKRLEDKGPNLKNFTHFYFSYAPIFNIENEINSKIIPGYSNYTQLGVRKKRKFCDYYAAGYDVSYSRLAYNLDQLATKTVPNTISFDKEKILVNNIGVELYNRFNFSKKRGDNLGFYVDIGAYANWMFYAKHVGKNIGYTTESKANVQKITNSRLDYINGFNYGARARIGFRKYILFGEYNLSGLFNDNYPNMFELPGIIAGVQLGIY